MAKRPVRKPVAEVDTVTDVEEGMTPDPAEHILVDLAATGSYTLMAQPNGWANDRQLFIDGVRVLHVGEDASGVWQYRQM